MDAKIEQALDDRAKDFLRSYVERGDSVKSLLDGQMGRYEPNGDTSQIGNYFDPGGSMSDLLGNKRKLIKLKRGQMAVKIGSDYKLYWVHEVYTKIILED
jgi:hypothetical protein